MTGAFSANVVENADGSFAFGTRSTGSYFDNGVLWAGASIVDNNGSSLTDMLHLVGVYVGRILKGEKPIDSASGAFAPNTNC